MLCIVSSYTFFFFFVLDILRKIHGVMCAMNNDDKKKNIINFNIKTKRMWGLIFGIKYMYGKYKRDVSITGKNHKHNSP